MRIVPLLLLLALLPAAPPPAAGQASGGGARGSEVRSVEIVGAGRIDDRLLASAVSTRETRCRSPLLFLACWLGVEGAVQRAYLDDAELRRDEERLASLHAAWGYPAATAAALVTRLPRGGVDVRFLVQPGEPLVIRSLDVRGLEAAAPRLRTPALPLVPGERFALADLQTAQRVLAGRLAAEGYAFAQVGLESRLPSEGGAVDLVLRVEPGPLAEFGTVTIEAERPLSVGDVRERLSFAPGDRFSPAQMERTIERLYRVPAVERVHIQPGPGADGEGSVDTEIFVTAAEPRGLQLEGAVSSYACIEGVVGWADRYFMDGPRVLALSAGASNLFAEPLRRFPCTGAGEDEFAQPDFFLRGDFSQPLGPDTWLHLGGGFSRESSPRAYIRRGVLGRISIVHEMQRGTDLTTSYSPERRDDPAAAPIYCAVYAVCSGERLAGLTGTSTLAPLEVALSFGPPRARRIDPGSTLVSEWTYPPLPGWALGGRVAVAAAAGVTGSEFAFSRLLVEGSFTRYPGRLFQLAGRVRGAWLRGTGPLPPQVRLFGGGPVGVRGVEPNLLGPRVLTVNRARVGELGCMAVTEGCEGIAVDPSIVRSRPLGGETLVEASLEGRVWAASYLQLAVFGDFGVVRPGAVDFAPGGRAETERVYTPGVGLLAITPVGPLRLDLAYDPSPARRYALLTRDEQGVDQVYLGEVLFDPYGFGEPDRWQELRRRVQIQLSMQQPF